MLTSKIKFGIIILSKDNNQRKSGKAEPEGKGVEMSENMTDKQLEVIMNLVADKFEACKDMEEVKKAIEEVRKMAKKEKAE